MSSAPPATLPRTKPPEAPVPAARNIPAGNQTLPRTGTNPFRTDTNPFRRESLPTESIDAGEYVTVAPRRGSLDDRFKLMPAQSDLKVRHFFAIYCKKGLFLFYKKYYLTHKIKMLVRARVRE